MKAKDVIVADESETLDIELAKDLLDENRRLAAQVRSRFDRHGVTAIDVMGSIGAGKTSLIESLVDRLKPRYKIAVIAGDVATAIDADRISRHGVTTVQINTGKECHLDANMIGKAVEKLSLSEVDLVFIENVGNLICPADYPLGAHRRLVVISVTEGAYMVVKHPLIFREADVLAINKMDLADVMQVDAQKLIDEARMLNPNVKAALTSAKTDRGIDDLITHLGL